MSIECATQMCHKLIEDDKGTCEKMLVACQINVFGLG